MNSSMTPQEAAEKLSYDSLDDIISALDAMYNSKKFMRKADYWSRCAGEAAIYLRKIAAGEYKPVVHAHWINTGYENSTGNIYCCNHCGKIYNPEKQAVKYTRQSEKPKYCPYCGALMDGKENNNAVD